MAVGIELLVDFIDCKCDRLNDENFLRETAAGCIKILKVKLENECFSRNKGLVRYYGIISESHIGIDAYPQQKEAHLSIFTCGGVHPHKALPYLFDMFKAKTFSGYIIERGLEIN